MEGHRRILIEALVLGLVFLNASKGLSATITVSSTANSGPGTLRAALADATNGDIIDATGISGTITLTTGELVISNSVSVRGPNTAVLSINGNFPLTTNAVFRVTQSATAFISNLVVTNGGGSGMVNDVSTLTVSNCTVSGNSFPLFAGGGVFNDRGTLTMVGCLLSGNNAPQGGGVYSTGYFAKFVNCTFSTNTTGGGGGAIHNRGGFVATSQVILCSCTLSDNVAGVPPGASVLNYSSFSTAIMEVGNTIFKANAANLFGTIISRGYNICSDTGAGALTATGDQINTDALLGPLQDNGGPTRTHALRAGSPALDKGKRDAVASLTSDVDQRGSSRPVDDPNTPNAAGGDGSDIGAYEASELRVVAVDKIGNNLSIRFLSVLGTNYVVERVSNLTSGGWTTLPGTIPGNGSVVEMIVTNALTPSRNFYRVRLAP